MHEDTTKLVKYDNKDSDRYSFWIDNDGIYHCYDSMTRILYSTDSKAMYEKWKTQA